MKQGLRFLGIVGFVASCILAGTLPQPVAEETVWVASWGTSQQIPEPQNALPSDDLRDATVRQIFHLLRRRSGRAGVCIECVRNRGTALHIRAHGASSFVFIVGDRRCQRSAADIRRRDRCDGSGRGGVGLGPAAVCGDAVVGRGSNVLHGNRRRRERRGIRDRVPLRTTNTETR